MANYYPMYTEKSFKELATLFLKHYGLAQMGWSVSMFEHDKHLGECDYEHKTLKFSRGLVSQVDNLQRIDTILHEIAHAIAGSQAEHGPGWKRIAKKIGAYPKAVARITASTHEYNYVWQTVCPAEHRYGTHHPAEKDFYQTCPMPTCNLLPTWYKYGVALDTLSGYAKV